MHNSVGKQRAGYIGSPPAIPIDCLHKHPTADDHLPIIRQARLCWHLLVLLLLLGMKVVDPGRDWQAMVIIAEGEDWVCMRGLRELRKVTFASLEPCDVQGTNGLSGVKEFLSLIQKI